MFNWLMKVPPKIGTTWMLRGECPFTDTYMVEILGIREGWVKYRPVWSMDSRYERIRAFRAMYKELNERKDSQVQD